MRKLVLGLTVCALAMAQTDLSGEWVGGPFSIHLKQEGNQLTGTAGLGENEQYPLKEGLIDGDRITFTMGTLHFDLRLDGAMIKGEVKMEKQTYPLILQRAEALKAAPAPAFEVASVKPSPPGGNRGSNMRLDPGRLTCTNVTLKSLLMRAYDVRPYQVSGPDWLDTEHYEIAAKFPAVYGTSQLLQALQALLAERFQVTVSRESRELPVYALVAGKGGFKLKAVEMGPPNMSMSRGKLTAKSVPMARLAEFVSGQVDRPVVDATGIQGVFDINLEWAQNEDAASDGGPTADIYTAIQQQLGLKLEMRKAPVEMLIVAHAEKVPIEN